MKALIVRIYLIEVFFSPRMVSSNEGVNCSAILTSSKFSPKKGFQ